MTIDPTKPMYDSDGRKWQVVIRAGYRNGLPFAEVVK